MIKKLVHYTPRLFLSIMILLLMPLDSSGANNQSQTFQNRIYQAYITGNISTWEKLLETLPANPTESELYEMAMAHYGYIGYCMGRDEKRRARPYLDRVEDLTDRLLEISPENPKYLALHGALFGFRMGYQPHKVPIIGPKSLKAINSALDHGPNCPEAWVESANKDWYLPAAFGGSKERAIEHYLKAIELMEQNLADYQGYWYYLNTHMILAEWYNSRNQAFLAKEVYRKLLAMEPNFQWATEKLQEK
ncbi:MAG: hypothetical protein M0P69_03990 [Bacteroidales bacterium]|nr:hypothetical protein [Bacteroidales bacterium]MDD2569674.1 hypothetical protein [Bacteroidales bacterium]MDD2811989.1 hypothetical protein [Bacteroidales bacterium]MDD3384785.1 hypothetical protein [Bacteroidales bacterium]MDD3810856.1 hypothetical protein [Bacteroidales bacterium]